MIKSRRYGILPTVSQSAVLLSATTPKATVVPQNDAYGKFPCPHCTNIYIHAKHLKRHLLRHTGERPYMLFHQERKPPLGQVICLTQELT
ncbi:hypothetical protein PG995_004550 [Apiospora arundinis]